MKIKVPRLSVNINVRRTFIAGLLVMVPLVITYVVLRLAFEAVDGLVQPVVEAILHVRIPGLGILVLIALIFVAGLLSLNFLGRWLITMSNETLARAPLVRTVHSVARQITESVFGTQAKGFQRVVMIEYPKPGIWAIGFLTATTLDGEGKTLAFVYMPHPPTPQSGWLAVVPIEAIYDTDLSIQDAMKILFSVATVVPDQIKRSRLSTEA